MRVWHARNSRAQPLYAAILAPISLDDVIVLSPSAREFVEKRQGAVAIILVGEVGDGYRAQFLARIAEYPLRCGIVNDMTTVQIRDPHRHVGGLEDRPPPLLARAECRFHTLALCYLRRQGFIRALQFSRSLL